MSKDYQKEVVDFLTSTPKKMGLEEGKGFNIFDKEIAVGAKAEKMVESFVKVLKKSKADKEAVAIVATAYKGIRSAMDILAYGEKGKP
jgi:hypothetical protein